jgi:hypothetical protein
MIFFSSHLWPLNFLGQRKQTTGIPLSKHLWDVWDEMRSKLLMETTKT